MIVTLAEFRYRKLGHRRNVDLGRVRAGFHVTGDMKGVPGGVVPTRGFLNECV